jgi:hypothetical protein
MPRQHSIMHYHALIRLFGAPNGLCSSITESKHIRAVKEPWRRSNCNEALGQILITNQRLDQLAAARTDFSQRGMLNGSCLTNILEGRCMFSFTGILNDVCVDIFSLKAAAATLTEDSDSLQVNTEDNMPLDIADMDDSVPPPTSIEDEDSSGGIVSEPNVLAEVKLSSKVCKCSFSSHYSSLIAN